MKWAGLGWAGLGWAEFECTVNYVAFVLFKARCLSPKTAYVRTSVAKYENESLLI